MERKDEGKRYPNENDTFIPVVIAAFYGWVSVLMRVIDFRVGTLRARMVGRVDQVLWRGYCEPAGLSETSDS